MKYGDNIFAINPCIMKINNKPTLTINKSYKIMRINDYEICVNDDDNDNHCFQLDVIGDYFITLKEQRKQKIKNINVK